MHLLGKILLVVNALAAGGLIYTAAQDWARRQEITGLVLQHHLVLKGLPLDAPPATDDSVPLNIETSGGHVVETVSPKLLANYFGSADGGADFGGGKAVGTQLQEMKRVEEKIEATLRSADDAARLTKLAGRTEANYVFTPGWLTAMAETFEEREVLRRLAATTADGDAAATKQAADTAEKMLKARLAAVTSAPDPKLAAARAAQIEAAVAKLRTSPADAAAQDELKAALSDEKSVASRDESDRKRLLAHTLMHLDPSAAWQKRVALVVGLRQLQNAVADHATRMQAMARSAQRQLEADQASFLDQYKQLETIAAERAQLLDQQTQIRKALESRSAADAAAAAKRKRQLEDRVAELDALRADVTKRLAEQASVEAAIFAAQKEAGQTLQRAFDLEAQLSGAEKAKR